jgi:AhpD family alkylhydroperoxidase
MVAGAGCAAIPGHPRGVAAVIAHAIGRIRAAAIMIREHDRGDAATTAAMPRAWKETAVVLDWSDYRPQLGTRVKELGRLSPDTVKGYAEIGAAGDGANLLGPKVRELIALAVGVTARCDGCIAVHTNVAGRQGATREDIDAKRSASRSL